MHFYGLVVLEKVRAHDGVAENSGGVYKVQQWTLVFLDRNLVI